MTLSKDEIDQISEWCSGGLALPPALLERIPALCRLARIGLAQDDGDMVMVPREPTDDVCLACHVAMEKALGYPVNRPIIPEIYRATINAKE